eukprot:gene13321-28219_t
MAMTASGRKALDSCQIAQYLASMSRYSNLDYVSRSALTALIFCDNGYISNVLLQSWLMPGGCSDELRKYCLHLLRCLLRIRPAEFYRWGLDVLASQLMNDDIHVILEEVSHDRSLLKHNWIGPAMKRWAET